MTSALKQARSHYQLWLFLTLCEKLLIPASAGATADCSGHFVIEDSTVKLFVQQHVNSSEDATECRYTFQAPPKSGLLIIANDIRAVNDGEIPGCPVSIYSNDDGHGDPLFSLCGHYSTVTIPVPSHSSLLVYKPVFRGTAYTLTLDLQVASTGESNLRACGDSRLNTVSIVPVRYSVGFRADSGDTSDFCDVNVRSTTAQETLSINCVLTSNGVCNYDVLLRDGSAAPSKNYVDLEASGGSATVRLHPAGTSGVLISKIPAEFEPVTFLKHPPSFVFGEGSFPNVTSDSSINETNVSTVQTTTVDDVAPGLWNRTKQWFRKAWKSVKNAAESTVRSVRNWFNG
ncbi:uncharacterized protein LOC119404341 [Rhipicephalus sanguineus]|uniref:uncharacterized protein LOC119404341 n=1 Tax=Rhipicephalus sanguineus TaxID=34632 RepID=UPI001893C4A5|nr:uncharacterized protein LOC119404341 [Rhipicephalus sanguineus]